MFKLSLCGRFSNYVLLYMYFKFLLYYSQLPINREQLNQVTA